MTPSPESFMFESASDALKTLFFIFIIGFLSLMFLLMLINRFSYNTWFCRKMGWHKAPKEQGFDGMSKNGVCPRCGDKVLQDSQGNWF